MENKIREVYNPADYEAYKELGYFPVWRVSGEKLTKYLELQHPEQEPIPVLFILVGGYEHPTYFVQVPSSGGLLHHTNSLIKAMRVGLRYAKGEYGMYQGPDFKDRMTILIPPARKRTRRA